MRPKRPSNLPKPSRNLPIWLYDTGSSVHISNDRSWFSDFEPNSGHLNRVITGGGPLIPSGKGSVTLTTITAENPWKYSTVTLHNVLYIPQFEINIFSGFRHYKAGGTISGERLLDANKRLFALLKFESSGFFLRLKDQPKPNHPFSHFCYAIEGSGPLEGPSRSGQAPARKTHRPSELSSSEPSVEPRAPLAPKSTGLSSSEPPVRLEAPLASGAPAPALAPSSETRLSSYQKLLQKALLWHSRLGHISLDLLKKTARLSTGIPNLEAVKPSDFQCEECAKTKAVRRLNAKPIAAPQKVLDRIEGDTFKITPPPLNKKPIGLILVDRKSRFRWVILLRSKEAIEVFQAVKDLFKALKNRFGRYPLEFHFDGGLEAANALLKGYLARKGIKFSTSSPYTPEQNGLAERSIRVIVDRLRATLLASGLPQHLWCYILPAIVELVNKTAITNRDVSPFQAFFDDLQADKAPHTPDLSAFRAIGSRCLALVPHAHRVNSQKLAPRTEDARLLAVLGSKTFLVYLLQQQRVLKTSLIRLYESPVPAREALRPVATEGAEEF